MRSKHLSVRKCIDKKPDKIKGIVCICIIMAVVCAGNMIPNYLISLKAAKIAKTSTTISNADISPYSHSISAEERLTKMMSLMQDNVNELWNGKYSEKREPLDTEIPVGQAYTAIQTFLKGACELQKQSGIMQMLGEDDIVMLQSLESNYSKDTDSETEQTYEAAPWQYGAAVTLDDSFDNTISDYFVTSDISKELSAWIFIISFEDTRMLAAVDAVLGVPFYITYYCADVDSPKAQAAVMRDLYAKTYGSDYSMGEPKESESKIDSSFETNIIENFIMGIIIRKGMMNIPVLNLMYTLVHRTSCRWNIRLLQESKDLKKRESKFHHIIRVLIYVYTNRTKSSLCNARELFICRPLLICAVCINYRLKEAGENFDPHFIIIITVSFSA